MEEISGTSIINMPIEEAWEKLQDLSMAHHYVPGVVDTKITTKETHGVNASRKVYRKNGQALDETVEEWQEGHGFLLRLHRGDNPPPAPFRKAWFRYRIDAYTNDQGISQTKVTTTLSFELRWGLLGKLIGRLLDTPFRKSTAAVAKRLSEFYESQKQ